MIRVLIADDEPIERMVVSKKIQKYFEGRLECVVAENGQEAVELFREKKCRIALLDISMPGMNGLEAAEVIREADKTCSIIFLTAYDDFSYAKKAFGVRALDYLLKPGADEELVAVLEEALHIAETEEKENAGLSAEAEEKPALQDQREIKNPASGPEEEKSCENARMLAVTESIRLYIQEHYREDISLQDAAGFMGYSDAYFCKIFKQCFDKNFTAYLTEIRVEMAKKLLADVTENIKDICAQVGFRDSNYFARVFKRMTGSTPSDYRNQVLSRMAGEKG